MSERSVSVFVDLDGEAIEAGRLHMRIVRGRERASFTYAAGWLTHPRRFALDPVWLPLGRGAFNTAGGEKLFPGLSDSAPDRWGRTLHAMLLDERSAEASLDTVLAVATYLGIEQAAARAIAGEVAAAVAGWRRVARRHGLSAGDLDRMASAFDHADLRNARKLAG